MSPNSVSSGMRLSIHPSKSTPTQTSSASYIPNLRMREFTHTDQEGMSQRKLLLVVNPLDRIGAFAENTSVDYHLSMWM